MQVNLSHDCLRFQVSNENCNIFGNNSATDFFVLLWNEWLTILVNWFYIYGHTADKSWLVCN